MLHQANRPSRDGQLEHPFGHSNSYEQYFHNLRGRQTHWNVIPTHWNAVGKVKNTKLNNFLLVWLLHSLHSQCGHLSASYAYTLNAAISLQVMQICSHALLFSCAILQTFTRETPATSIQQSWAFTNHVIERRPSSVYHYSCSSRVAGKYTEINKE